MKKIFKPSVMLNPVPVVLVTSKNKNGEENVFTVAWIGTVCTKPLCCLFPFVQKDFLMNISKKVWNSQ